MRTLLLVGACFMLMILSIDLVDCFAREFEHSIEDSRIEKPDHSDIGMVSECSRNETGIEKRYHSMIATAYCLTGSTATGTTPRVGVAASKPSWFGKRVNVYQNDSGQPGVLIGTYTVEDTGGAPIRNGSVIDIWLPDEDTCFQFGRRCVIVEVID